MPMGPLEFEPIIKSIRWGGTRLGSELNKELDGRTDAAESWEIADQPDGRSVVSSGPWRGRTLSSLLDSHAADIFGDHPSHTQFPLLIKFLDAHDRLSLQVHPDNNQAAAYGVDQRGKTEAWFIMAAEPDSQIYAGLKEGVDRQDLENAIVTGRIEACLHRYHVEAGQAVFIPAGTVHAIGEGILLAEVQQQSNLTFRLHDWGRLGADGQPRELHLEQALACIDFDRGPVDCVEPKDLTAEASCAGRSKCDVVERLVDCDFFTIDRCSAQQSCSIQTRGQFRILMMTGGQGTLSGTQAEIHLEVGKTVLLPAGCESLILEPASSLTWLETFVPDPNGASAIDCG
jgi:mannose-6-phosphate isomerase